jgi:AcrR family transcriptional regulator
MPRVVPEYKEEAKRRILEVATRTVIEKGYQQVRMDDIAREAGVSRPTLYLYYKNKETLLTEIIESVIHQVGMMAAQTICSGNAKSFVEFFILANTQYRDLFQVVFDVMTGMPDKHEMIERISDMHSMMVKQISLLIAKQSLLKEDRDPEIFANALLALFIGLQVRQNLGLSPDTAAKVWEEVLTGSFHHGLLENNQESVS